MEHISESDEESKSMTSFDNSQSSDNNDSDEEFDIYK